MRESKFQSGLIQELKDRFPGCLILKNDPNYIQGIPDLLILYSNKWAMLEVKKNLKASIQPNQKYYIDKANNMSFGNIICPENKEDILDALERTFKS